SPHVRNRTDFQNGGLSSKLRAKEAWRSVLNPRVMVISTNQWPMVARISLSLANVGFSVGVISPPSSVIRKITGGQVHYDFHSWSASRSILGAIKDWSPVLLICADDRAVEE